MHQRCYQQPFLSPALGHAFAWLGFGAKTRVGPGTMQLDVDAARRDAMPADQRAVQEALDARPDRNASELSVLLKWLKSGSGLDAALLPTAAEMARAQMQAAKKWVEKSTKKNPDKDHDHQDTKAVLAHLRKR